MTPMDHVKAASMGCLIFSRNARMGEPASMGTMVDATRWKESPLFFSVSELLFSEWKLVRHLPTAWSDAVWISGMPMDT